MRKQYPTNPTDIVIVGLVGVKFSKRKIWHECGLRWSKLYMYVFVMCSQIYLHRQVLIIICTCVDFGAVLFF